MSHHFPFVQLSFTHAIGPPPGRYVLNDVPSQDELALGAADVLVVRVVGAATPKRSVFRRNAVRKAETKDIGREVPVAEVTVVRGTRRLDDAAAHRLMTELRDEASRDPWIAAALADVNRAVAYHRACAADPYPPDLTRADSRTITLGWGRAEEVFAGRWSEALTVMPREQPLPRQERLRPQQGLAAALAGHGDVLECEELLLAAQRDFDAGRLRAAAVGVHAGIELLLGELAGKVLSRAVRGELEDVIDRRPEAEALAARGRRGTLEEGDETALRSILDAAGGVVDRRRYEPLGY